MISVEVFEVINIKVWKVFQMCFKVISQSVANSSIEMCFKVI